MVDGLRLIIYKNKSIYDDIIVDPQFVDKFNVHSKNDFIQEQNIFEPVILRKKGFNAYLVSILINTLHNSEDFRQSVIDVFTQFHKLNTNSNKSYPLILIKLRNPQYQFLDYSWNKKITQMLVVRLNIDTGMSWLSTLGGAFSSLGDEFDNCAKIAGEISLEQFKLSVQLQDPQLIARCKLYVAISLLQQGNLRTSKRMVKNIYEFAVNDKDVRLQRMCQGVWAKLKYCYSIKNQKRKKIYTKLTSEK